MSNELKKMKTCNAHAWWQSKTCQVQNFKRPSRDRKLERKEAWGRNEKRKRKNEIPPSFVVIFPLFSNVNKKKFEWHKGVGKLVVK